MLELGVIFKIGHILGVALGAGGAFVSDFIFLSSVKDKRISRTEMRFITLGSRIVWAGLILLIISGIGLLSLDPERLLSSDKFLAKMTIVGIITLNGVVFHTAHIPLLRRLVGQTFSHSTLFLKRAPLLLASGAISSTSWISALVLGAARRLPYNYKEIMGAYFVILIFAIAVALLIRKRVVS